MENWIDTSLAEAVRLAGWLTEHERVAHTIQQMGDRLAVCLTNGGRGLTCGNGGSMCDAMHMAEELSGRFRHDRQALAAQAISDPAHLTCVANDFGYQQVFARGVEAWGRLGDV